MLTQHGALITEMRGKLGGQVYSKNRYGSFVANTYKPTNPKTIAQQQNRVYLSRSVAAWKQLSEAERLSWNSAAVYLKGNNCFGDSFSYTAYQCYIKCSLIYLAYNNDQLTSCPPLSIPKPFRYFSFIIDLEHSTFTLDVNYSGLLGLGTALYATRPLPAGRKPKASDYRRFFITGSLNLYDDVITDYYVNYFGRFPSPGEYVYMKLCSVDTSAGLLSMPLFASAVCSSYLQDITPYNLQQASFNPATKVLTLNASTSAFAALCACDSSKAFSFSFRLTSTAVGGSWRINLCTIDTYIVNTDTRNVHRISLNPSVYTIGISRVSDSFIISPVPSMSYVYRLSYNGAMLSLYYSVDGVTFILLSSITVTLLAFSYITVKTITATQCIFDNLKFSQ